MVPDAGLRKAVEDGLIVWDPVTDERPGEPHAWLWSNPALVIEAIRGVNQCMRCRLLPPPCSSFHKHVNLLRKKQNSMYKEKSKALKYEYYIFLIVQHSSKNTLGLHILTSAQPHAATYIL